MLTRTDNSPLVAKTVAGLRAELGAGKHTIGQPLPTHREWAKRFRVSPFTVRRALELLKAEGIVESTEGSYTYLRKIPEAQTSSSQEHHATPVTLWFGKSHDLRKLRQAVLRGRFQPAFEQQHPGVRIEENLIEQEPDTLQVLLLQTVLTEPRPTAARTTHTYLDFLRGHDALAPIAVEAHREYWERLDPRYRQRCARDGRVEMLPTNITYSHLLYNKALFARAGLRPDQPPRDWDEFTAACRALAQADGGKPSFHLLGARSVVFWLMHLAYQCGPSPAGDSLPSVTWRSVAASRAAEWFIRLHAANLIRIHTGDATAFTAATLANAVPMLLGDGSVAAQIAALGEAERFGVAPLPVGPNGRVMSLLDCGGWFINARATPEEQAAATEYVFAWERWLHEGDGGAQMKRFGVWPSFTSIFQDARQDRFGLERMPADWLGAIQTLQAHGFWEAADADWQKVALGRSLEGSLGQDAPVSPEQLLYHLRIAEHECGLAAHLEVTL